jgi:hypothetical protein
MISLWQANVTGVTSSQVQSSEGFFTFTGAGNHADYGETVANSRCSTEFLPFTNSTSENRIEKPAAFAANQNQNNTDNPVNVKSPDNLIFSILSSLERPISTIAKRLVFEDKSLGLAALGTKPMPRAPMTKWSDPAKRVKVYRPPSNYTPQKLLNLYTEIRKIQSGNPRISYQIINEGYLTNAMRSIQQACEEYQIEARPVLELLVAFYMYRYKRTPPLQWLGTEEFRTKVMIMCQALTDADEWKKQNSELADLFDLWMVLCREQCSKILKFDPFTSYPNLRPYFEWCFLQAYETWREMRPRFEHEHGLEMQKPFYVMGNFHHMKQTGARNFEAIFGAPGRIAAAEYVRDYEPFNKITTERRKKLDAAFKSDGTVRINDQGG